MSIEEKILIGVQVLSILVSCGLVGWLVYRETGLCTTIFVTVLWGDSIIKNQINLFFKRRQRKIEEAA